MVTNPCPLEDNYFLPTCHIYNRSCISREMKLAVKKWLSFHPTQTLHKRLDTVSHLQLTNYYFYCLFGSLLALLLVVAVLPPLLMLLWFSG